jgi:uncharacterized membrane protein YuzA (DUF378 family)
MHNFEKFEKNIIRGENMIIAQKIALILTIVGSINWGLVGIFNFNLVEFLFSTGSIMTRIIYIIILACGLFNLGFLFLNNRDCHMDDF